MSQPISTVTQSETPFSVPERRAFVRFVRSREARIQSSNAPTQVFGLATIQDISVNGLKIFVNSRVKVGTILQIDPKGIRFPRSLLARIVHATPQGNGWIYGCELANHLSESELQLLLS